MSKDIVIQQKGVPENMTVDSIRGNSAGGGTERWVPDDDIATGTIDITDNGRYKASDHNLIGFTEANVNLKEVKGIKDGVTYKVTVNQQGYLVYTEVQEAIS